MNAKQVRMKLQQIKIKYSKYKYAFLILCLGILLMGSHPKRISAVKTPPPEPASAEDLEGRLQGILQQIEGAGRVECLLTMERSSMNTYQQDEQHLIRADDEDMQVQTVIIKNSDREDTPILLSVFHPLYRGAVVVCDGADNPTVKLNIVRAVSRATGLSSDKISVIKMNDK